MLTLEEKMEKIEEAMLYIEAFNNILLDSLDSSRSSCECQYIILLEYQKEHIKKITNLF